MLVFVNAQNPNGKSTLTVVVKNLQSNEGQVLIAVYNSSTNYMKEEKALFKEKSNIQNNKAVIVLPELPQGKYAVVCVHDANKNLKLDKNLLGIPREGYGFSNDAKGNLGPPSFEKSSFTIEKNLQIIINMSYW